MCMRGRKKESERDIHMCMRESERHIRERARETYTFVYERKKERQRETHTQMYFFRLKQSAIGGQNFLLLKLYTRRVDKKCVADCRSVLQYVAACCSRFARFRIARDIADF